MGLRFENRGTGRLRLKRPARAFVSGRDVQLVNLSPVSAGIENTFELKLGGKVRLEFYWGEQQLVIACEVTRTKLKRGATAANPVYSTGLLFNDSTDISLATLRKLIAEAETKAREPKAD
jgi:hypothetical protein